MAPRWKMFEHTEQTMGVGYGLIAAIVVFGGAGYLLDRWLNTSPWLLFAGLAVGLLVGFYALRGLIRQTR